MVSVLLEYIMFIISMLSVLLEYNNYGECFIRVYRSLLIFLTYYAGIMLDAFRYLLCSKLCWHNRPEPSRRATRQCHIWHSFYSKTSVQVAKWLT